MLVGLSSFDESAHVPRASAQAVAAAQNAWRMTIAYVAGSLCAFGSCLTQTRQYGTAGRVRCLGPTRYWGGSITEMRSARSVSIGIKHGLAITAREHRSSNPERYRSKTTAKATNCSELETPQPRTPANRSGVARTTAHLVADEAPSSSRPSKDNCS
jgi:hypothetical protein